MRNDASPPHYIWGGSLIREVKMAEWKLCRRSAGAVASLALAGMLSSGCAPEDYPREPAADAQASHEVTGGTDPTSISGRVQADSEDTIHHPGADGNTGRAPERVGTRREGGS